MVFEVSPKNREYVEAESSPSMERTGAEPSEVGRDEGAGGVRAGPTPDPEVGEKATRRRFSAEYKLRILKRAEACKGKPGALGELLRKEGLYSSHLSSWRRQREQGELEALSARRRGRKANPRAKKSQREKDLERENRRLKRRLEKVELMLEIQKKTSELLGIPLSGPESAGKD